MENFGLADLGWVLVMVAAAAFLMGGGISMTVNLFRTARDRYVVVPVSSIIPAPPVLDQSAATSPPQQDQPGLDQSAITFAMIAEYLARHNLTDEQLIIVYARAHRANDDYPLSANKIRDAVGGGRDDVLASIASHRPKKSPPPRRLERPANGW